MCLRLVSSSQWLCIPFLFMSPASVDITTTSFNHTFQAPWVGSITGTTAWRWLDIFLLLVRSCVCEPSRSAGRAVPQARYTVTDRLASSVEMLASSGRRWLVVGERVSGDNNVVLALRAAHGASVSSCWLHPQVIYPQTHMNCPAAAVGHMIQVSVSLHHKPAACGQTRHQHACDSPHPSRRGGL